jgi:hypothetical protein
MSKLILKISSICTWIRKIVVRDSKKTQSLKHSTDDASDPILKVIGIMEGGNIADRIDEELYGEDFRKSD